MESHIPPPSHELADIHDRSRKVTQELSLTLTTSISVQSVFGFLRLLHILNLRDTRPQLFSYCELLHLRRLDPAPITIRALIAVSNEI